MSSINALSSPELVSEQRNSNKVFLLLGILIVFAPLSIVGAIGEWLGDDTILGIVLINVAYLMSILIATAVLKWFGSGWREIGMARPASWLKTALLGIGTMVVYAVASLAFQALLQNVLAPNMAPADRSNFNALVGNLPRLLLSIFAAWTIIAFGEEMLFRAFLINGLAGLFPGARARWVFALVGSSLVFGFAHFSWGLGGVVETAFMGLFLGFVFLRTGRNLWVTIIAHALLNTVGFIYIYSGGS